MFGSNPIAGLFGKSPFKPTQQHMEAVEKCASECVPLFAALLAGDGEKAAGHKDRVFELENEADDIKNQIRSQLPKSLLMPVQARSPSPTGVPVMEVGTAAKPPRSKAYLSARARPFRCT